MPRAGDDRGDATGQEEAAGDGQDATRAFSRPASGAPDHPTERTAAPDAPADEEASRARDGAESVEGTVSTQVMLRPGASGATGSEPGLEPCTRLDSDPEAGTMPEPPEMEDDRRRRPGDGPRTAKRPARRRRVRLRWIVAIVLLLVLAAPPATWLWVWYTARSDERPASDAILVLGASQYNGRPSPIFEARLKHALDLYHQGVAPAVVTVGGNQPGDNYTEGGSGQEWLIEQGMPADDTVAVETGHDTLQSVEAVGDAFKQREWSSVVIVTDPWHSLRSREMAEDYGMEAATSPSRSGPAVIERETQMWYITRETASLWYYWVFGDSSDIDVNAMPGAV